MILLTHEDSPKEEYGIDITVADLRRLDVSQIADLRLSKRQAPDGWWAPVSKVERTIAFALKSVRGDLTVGPVSLGYGWTATPINGD